MPFITATFLVKFTFLAVSLAHIFICPYTKVEESFNLQDIHDILFLRTNISQVSRLFKTQNTDKLNKPS